MFVGAGGGLLSFQPPPPPPLPPLLPPPLPPLPLFFPSQPISDICSAKCMDAIIQEPATLWAQFKAQKSFFLQPLVTNSGIIVYMKVCKSSQASSQLLACWVKTAFTLDSAPQCIRIFQAPSQTERAAQGSLCLETHLGQVSPETIRLGLI